MRAEIDGAAAAGQRRVEHPGTAGVAIALREARDEAEAHVLDAVARLRAGQPPLASLSDMVPVMRLVDAVYAGSSLSP
jgi:hypothetical protein